MSICAEILEDGSIVAVLDSIESCTGVVLISVTDYSLNYQSLGITVADFSAAFSVGFGLVFMMALPAWKVAIAKRSIRAI